MALNTPPKHTIEAAAGLTSIFIHDDDRAWDKNRITREVKEYFGGENDQHPVFQYHAGLTRYDLEAESVVGSERVTPRTYLLGKATEFRLRRLSTIDVARIHSWLGVSPKNTPLAMDYACRRGIVTIENLAITFFASDGELSDTTMQELYDCGPGEDGGGGVNMITDIGLAIWRLSQPLSYAEKKS